MLNINRSLDQHSHMKTRLTNEENLLKKNSPGGEVEAACTV